VLRRCTGWRRWSNALLDYTRSLVIPGLSGTNIFSADSKTRSKMQFTARTVWTKRGNIMQGRSCSRLGCQRMGNLCSTGRMAKRWRRQTDECPRCHQENLYRNPRILVTTSRHSSGRHRGDLLRTSRMVQGRTSTTHNSRLLEICSCRAALGPDRLHLNLL
jgi:hypothetical protein